MPLPEPYCCLRLARVALSSEADDDGVTNAGAPKKKRVEISGPIVELKLRETRTMCRTRKKTRYRRRCASPVSARRRSA